MPYRMQGLCWHCAHSLQEADYAREARCPNCDYATHVCRNCRFYAPSKSGDCAEPQADYVADKTHPNFCGYFEASDKRQGDAAADDAEQLRQAADDLFDL